ALSQQRPATHQRSASRSARLPCRLSSIIAVWRHRPTSKGARPSGWPIDSACRAQPLDRDSGCWIGRLLLVVSWPLVICSRRSVGGLGWRRPTCIAVRVGLMITHEIIDDSADLLLEVAVRAMIESALAANDCAAVVPRFVIRQGVAAFALGRNMDLLVI